MRRLLRRVLLSLLLLGVLIVSSVGLLLGTNSGINLVLRQLDAYLPGLFSVARVEGDLLGRLTISGLQLHTADAEIEIDRLLLDWIPSRLLKRQLLIREISASGLRYTVAGDTAASDEPLQLPVIVPPVDIVIQQLALSDAQLIIAADSEPLQIERLELAADWSGERVVLRYLRGAMPGISLTLSGELRPAENYQLKLQQQLHLTLAELPELQVSGAIEGDQDGLGGRQTITGDLDAVIDLQLFEPLAELRWRLLAEQMRVPLAQFADTLPALLSGRLQGAGGLSTATLTGSLATRSEDDLYNLDAELDLAARIDDLAVSINKLQIRRPEAPLVLDLAGTVDAQQRMDIQGSWQSLQWPLAGVAEFASDQGRFTLQGAIDDYRLKVDLGLSGRDFPPGEWSVEGAGSSRQFTLDRLLGRLLDGEFSATGRISWAPEIDWDLKLQAKRINPGSHYPEWPGRINLAAAVSGSVVADGAQAKLSLQRLDGTLRDYPLAGSGEIDYSPSQVRIDALTLSSGSSRMTAKGVLGDESKLQWSVDIPTLANLLPGAEGVISGQGTITGSQALPQIQLELSARALQYSGLQLQQLTARADLDMAERRPGSLRIEGSGLQLDGQRISHFSVRGDGLLARQQLSLQLAHQLGSVRAELQGGYDGKRWAGTLQQLGLQSQQLGNWRQQRPVKFSATADSAQIGQLCLLRESTALCSGGEWAAASGVSGQFDLNRLPLAWLKPLLPANVASLSGDLSASGKLVQGDLLTGELTAALTPGEALFNRFSDQLRVPYSGASVQLHATQGGVDAKAKIEISDNRFSADFSSPDLLTVSEPKQARISGRLNLHGPNFNYLRGMVPGIETIDGSLSADFDLDGTLARPQLRGDGKVDLTKLSVPLVGLDLSDTRINIRVDGNIVYIDSSLKAGGSLQLKGQVDLNQSGFPASATLQGERFLALNLPEAKLLITPDLRFSRDSGGMLLSGELAIPEAEILLKQLPEGTVSASDDIVVMTDQAVPAEAESNKTSPTRVDVSVLLGERVHVAALGLNAFLKGAVKVTANPGQPVVANGEVRIDQGTYRAYSQDLVIERGVISYAGGAIDNPGIDIRATRSIDDVIVGINAFGTATKPKITTFSTPSMSSRDVINYLITGKPTNAGAKLSIGHQINNKLTVGVGTDTSTGESEFTTRYQINRKIHVEATSSTKSSSGDIFYSFEKE